MSRRGTSFRIYDSHSFDSIRLTSTFTLPNQAAVASSPISGGLLYQPSNQKVYYSNGSTWIPLSTGGGGTGTSTSYSSYLTSDIVIPPSLWMMLTGFTDVPIPPYHDNTGNWNFSGGIYTANVACTISLNLDMSWKSGISNLGWRYARIMYKPFGGIASAAKESSTQADPATNVDTTQELGLFLEMGVGDQAWVEVMHTAPTNLLISGGIATTLSGEQIIT